MQIGRVRVIFCLPHKINLGLGLQDSPGSWPKVPLAYIEWYSKPKPEADKHTGMYTIKSTWNLEGIPLGAIVPISEIRQSCMLIPKYKNLTAEKEWTSLNVLDQCPSFVINNWQHLYAYQTIW
jgi:hypothetical protein